MLKKLDAELNVLQTALRIRSQPLAIFLCSHGA